MTRHFIRKSTLDAETIQKLIETGLPGARAQVSGEDGVHFEATVVSDHGAKSSRKANSIGPTPATFGRAFVMSSISAASSCACPKVSAVQPSSLSAA